MPVPLVIPREVRTADRGIPLCFFGSPPGAGKVEACLIVPTQRGCFGRKDGPALPFNLCRMSPGDFRDGGYNNFALRRASPMTQSAPSFDLSLLDPILFDHAPGGRAHLLPTLLEAQRLYGHVPEPVAEAIGRALRVPLADIYGVLEFYTMLYSQPAGRRIVRVCTSPMCSRLGGESAVEAAACLAHTGVFRPTSLRRPCPSSRRHVSIRGKHHTRCRIQGLLLRNDSHQPLGRRTR